MACAAPTERYHRSGSPRLRAACVLAGLALIWQGGLVGAAEPGADGEAGGTIQNSQPASRPTPTSTQASRPLKSLFGDRDSDGDLRDGSTDVLWRMLAYVLVILALGALGMVVVKRWLPRMGVAPSRGREVTVIETTHLASRRTVHLVQVGNRRFLLGSTDQSVAMLAEVTSAFPEVLEAHSHEPLGEERQDKAGGGGA